MVSVGHESTEVVCGARRGREGSDKLKYRKERMRKTRWEKGL